MLKGTYKLYDKKFTDDEIRAEFFRRRGYYPDGIHAEGGGKLDGPLRPDEQLQSGETFVTGTIGKIADDIHDLEVDSWLKLRRYLDA